MSRFKIIEGYEDYLVSDSGEVISRKYGKERKLKLKENSRGYNFVILSKSGKCKSKSVHRLVAMAFLKALPGKDQVNHINGVKTDNNVSNLEWVNSSENMKHSFDIGLRHPKKGEEIGNSKLKIKDVLKIRELYNSGDYTQYQIAELFGVSRENISSIITRKSWN